MLYIIAMIEGDYARVYNTSDNTFKDLKLATIAKLKQNGAEVKNTGPLKEDGTFLVYGGRNNYPKFKSTADGKKLVTPNIPTVVAHTDAGKTIVVDAFGQRTQKYTRSLSDIALTNAEYLPNGTLEGYFETMKFSEYLRKFEESMSVMAGFMGAESPDFGGYRIEDNTWYYTGDKKTDTITIPEGVQYIAPDTLDKVIAKELILPSTLLKLEKGSLAGVFTQLLIVQAGVLRAIGNQAFAGTKISELRLYGLLNVHPMAFHGSRVTRIFAQGNTYKQCVQYKSGPTIVKVLHGGTSNGK